MDTITGIKNKAYVGLADAIFSLEEGEMLQFRGGLGNKEIVGMKKEEGQFYRRDFEGEWYEFDPAQRFYEMAMESVKTTEEVRKKRPKLVELFKRLYK